MTLCYASVLTEWQSRWYADCFTIFRLVVWRWPTTMKSSKMGTYSIVSAHNFAFLGNKILMNESNRIPGPSLVASHNVLKHVNEVIDLFEIDMHILLFTMGRTFSLKLQLFSVLSATIGLLHNIRVAKNNRNKVMVIQNILATICLLWISKFYS